MSLLDDGPHTLTVVPRTRVPDKTGGWKYVDEEPQTITGSCQPLSAEESTAMGLQGRVVYSFITRGPWPWSMVSKIIWSGAWGQWPDREWDQDGEAKVYGMPGLTQHIDVTLVAREAASSG